MPKNIILEARQMSIAKFSIKNPVLVNMIMIAVIVLGSYSLFTLPREMMPEVSFPWIFVWTPAPGLSPEDTEKLITNEVEKEVRDVEGIDNITSISRENASFVWIKFETMSDDELDKRLQDVRTEVEKVELPEGAEDPIITEFTTQDHIPMVNVVLSGNISEIEMKKLAEDLRDDILEINNVSKCLIAGVRDREIWVEVDPEKLQSYDLALSQVMEAIRGKNLDLSAGDIKMGRWEYIVRTVGEIDKIEQVKKIILRANPMGHHVRVEDIAEVRDTFEESEVISRFNCEPSVTLTVAKKKQGNSIKIIDEIKDLVEKYRRERLPQWETRGLPANVSINVINDTSIRIKEILNVLRNNAWLGMILVVVCLYFFLGLRNAIFAAIGIPVTFMFTFLFMKYTSTSLSGSALFGLVLVLGMIVDDAIVIIENCYRHMQEGHPPKEAVIIGTKQVAMPVISSSLTTIAAFLPLMLMGGIIGQFLKIVPIVVTLALLASLFEAFFILPSHIAEWSRKHNHIREGFIRFNKLRRLYIKYLVKFLRYRYQVLGITTLIILVSIPLIWVVGIDMFASEEIPRVFIFVDLPEGTKLEITDEVIQKVEKIISALSETELVNVVANSGLQQREDEWFFKPSVGQLIVELTNKEKRKRSIDDIIADLRGQINSIAGIKSLEFKVFDHGPPTGAPVEVKVRGNYLDELEEVAELIKNELKSMIGVFDVRDDFVPGKRELQIVVDEEKAALVGLNVAQIASTVHYAFDGGVATEFRDGDEEIDVVVKYKEDSRQNISDLENMKIATPFGHLVTLKDVARLNTKQGYTSIKHDELKRAITVKADIDKSKTTALKVNKELQRRFFDISKRYSGYDLVFRGQFEEFKQAFSDLGQLFLVGLILMYIILGGQFKSFFQPLIIFMAIIFAFWGATMGLLFIGSPFNINNLYGLVALAGVAVNDALVFISFINEARARRVRRWHSILMAGKLRLRPILLTTITTVFGLLPMAIGIGGKSDVWGPLANVMVWGLSVGTILTLFLVPCLYAILGDIKRSIMGKRFMDEKGRIITRERRALEIAPEPDGKALEKEKYLHEV
ncbi:MAG: efflux RND transporter permease subunit [bacterium]